MSLSEYFRKKSGAILFASTVAVSGFGAYLGVQAVQEGSDPKPTPSIMTTPSVHPSLSTLTLDQHNQDTLEGKLSEEKRLEERGIDPNRAARIADFTRLIERIEQDGEELASTQKEIERIKGRAAGLVNETNVAEVLKAKELRAAVLDTTRVQAGEKFVNELREANNITEVDYTTLVATFDKRAAVTLHEKLENYRDGAMYKQECQIVISMASFFSMDDDEETSADIGACMKGLFDNPERIKQEAQKSPPAPMPAPAKAYGMEEAAGALSGAAIGSMLTVPFWLRRRRQTQGF